MIVTKDFIFDFGKYEGRSVNDIFWINAEYLLWCNDNIEGFDLYPELLKNVLKRIEILHQYRATWECV